MASNSGTNKRQRTAPDTLHISDLPIGFIVDVSAYLPKPSRAILSVAFTSSSLWQDLMHRQSPISKAIISAQQWDTLDFQDINKELANKLTDNDISAVLKSINAHDVLKRLKLCGCINIEGQGLNPLQGSIVLEQIDTSFTPRYGCQEVLSEAKISLATIISILDSIISAEDCSLKYIQFPRAWRQNVVAGLARFQRRYTDMFTRRSSSSRLCCSHCNANMEDQFWMTNNMLQNNICYNCLKPFCEECADRDLEERNEVLNFCDCCKKDYCQNCLVIEHCSNDCGDWVCTGCKKSCEDCDSVYCEDCLKTCPGCNKSRCPDCTPLRICDGDACHDSIYCAECLDANGRIGISYCSECRCLYCFGCRADKVKKDGVDACRGCSADITPLLLEENSKLRKEKRRWQRRMKS